MRLNLAPLVYEQIVACEIAVLNRYSPYFSFIERGMAFMQAIHWYSQRSLLIIDYFLRLCSGEFENRKFGWWDAILDCFYEFAPINFDDDLEN